jgi:hypothetical protein
VTGEANHLAQMLAARCADLTRELLPGGTREGAEFRCGSLSGERGRSMAVHLHGNRAGVWSDFASGETGDALDLVAAVLFGNDIKAAMTWARQWLGLDGVASYALPPQTRPAPRQAAEAPKIDTEAEARRGAARQMFLAAQPGLRGTPAGAYLAGRGLDLAELKRQPRCLRFVPALPNRESGRSWPALVAAITSLSGEHVATHRTWLALNEAARQWRKAPLRDAKMTLGSYAGGTIRLWRGASGKPLAQATQGETVALAEGLETSLSIVLACPELRVLCAVSLANMGRVELPPAVETVLICCDNDGDNPSADRALRRAIDHFTTSGRTVKIARPPAGVKDFNDLLQVTDK